MTLSLTPGFCIYISVLTTFSRCHPAITSISTAWSGFFFSLSCFRCSLHSPRQQEQSPSEPVYYASFRLFKTSHVRVNINSGRASCFKRGMQAASSVIILWDNYFIITPLYLSKVIDIGVVCFHFIPTHLFTENHWLDATATGGDCGRFRRADKWTEKIFISPGDCQSHWWVAALMTDGPKWIWASMQCY